MHEMHLLHTFHQKISSAQSTMRYANRRGMKTPTDDFRSFKSYLYRSYWVQMTTIIYTII